MNIEELRHVKFDEIEPGPAKTAPSWKLAVLKSGAIRITVPESLAGKIVDRPVHVGAAIQEGRALIRLALAGAGKTHSFVRRGVKNGRLGYFSLTLHRHSFEPGVVHKAVAVKTLARADGGLVIECPDWDEMLGEALSGADDAAEDEGGEE